MIATARLGLVLLGDGAFDDPHGVLAAAADVIALRRAQVAADPSCAPWLLRAIVLDGVAIGTIGFHGAPVDGVVELGYEVMPAFRRRGYALEAATAMIAWARPHVVRASVAPDNAASIAMLDKLGFVRVGDRIDDEDGLELVYEC